MIRLIGEPSALAKTEDVGEETVRAIATAILLILYLVAPANAASQFGTKDEAVAMVHRVQEMFKKEGPEATFKAVDDKSNKSFHDRDLYVFIYTLDGVCVAHGDGRLAMIGKNFIDMKDQDGKYMHREMAALAKNPGSGWVDYKFPNPVTNKIENKSAYIEKLGTNYFAGVGIYSQ